MGCKASGACLVDDFIATLEVSPVIVRRDLERLAGKSYVKCFYGGVRLISPEEPIERLKLRTDAFLEEKRRIGAKASEFVDDGDSIMLHAGTTVMEVARSLRGKRNLKVVVC